MRTLMIIWVFLLGLGGGDQTLETAYGHFDAGEYPESLRFFREALRIYPENAASIYFNMAQCMIRLDSLDQAQAYFRLAVQPKEPQLASLAYNNIGILEVEQLHFQDALEAFRNAMIQDPDNEVARRNYELLKRQLQNQQEKQQPNTNSEEEQEEEDSPDDQNASSPPQATNNPPPASIGEYQELIERLTRRNRPSGNTDDQPLPQSLDTISMEQAQQLLEKMQQEDVQFLQQLRKSPVAPAKKEGKPDW